MGKNRFAIAVLVVLFSAAYGRERDGWREQVEAVKKAVGFDSWRKGMPRLLPVLDFSSLPQLAGCQQRHRGSVHMRPDAGASVSLSWRFRSEKNGHLDIEFGGYETFEGAAETMLVNAVITRSASKPPDYLKRLRKEFTHEFGAVTHRTISSKSRMRIRFVEANWSVKVSAGGDLLQLGEPVCRLVSDLLKKEPPGRSWPEKLEKPRLVAGKDGKVVAGTRVEIRADVPELEEGVEWWLDWSEWRDRGGSRDNYVLYEVKAPGPLKVRATYFDSRGRILPLQASLEVISRD